MKFKVQTSCGSTHSPKAEEKSPAGADMNKSCWAPPQDFRLSWIYVMQIPWNIEFILLKHFYCNTTYSWNILKEKE